jgi:hypothetical protein
MWNLTKVRISYLFNIQVPTIMNENKATSDSDEGHKTNFESEAAKNLQSYWQTATVMKVLSIKLWDLGIVNYQFLISYYSEYFHSRD